MKNLAYIVVEDKIMDKKKVEISVEENIDEIDDKEIWYSFTINSLTNIFEGIQDDR